ncbi:DUF2207 domain-containing protein [Thermocaproicibacter melissae]|jgi:uncharacterized membrane protein|uniref:DUF2207 domain-containing protein n=1 Tax=Thermocaproicibacter melissae TaxID=2966552 RepID=UPI0024B228DD|nr:DUF2207 domain-containing protein [Thermocaproicibacter melissae]WBY64205.1 DUF2207 domain-containing protein [Thermocaproicibacter melissae]
MDHTGKMWRKKPSLHRTLRIAAIALAAVMLVLSCTGCDDYRDDAEQLMEQLNIVVEPQKNGDVKMTETWRVNLEERDRPYKNFYRTFQNDSEKADDITDLTVYDEDEQCQYKFIGDVDPENGSYEDNTCYIHKTGAITELGWFMPSMDSGVRTFKISYTIKNLVSVYKDTAVLYQFLVPDQFSIPIASLTGTIRLPEGGKKDDLRVWMHSDASGQISINSATQISFSAKEIPANTYVDVRVCMPTGLFADSPKQLESSALQSIQAEEQEWARKAQERKERERRLGILDVCLGLFAVATGIVILTVRARNNRRFRVDAPEYTREIPEGNSPAGVAKLFYYYSGGVKNVAQDRVLSATLMSLAQKGYLVFSGTGKNYAIGIAPEEYHKKPLSKSEEIFYDLMKDVAENNGGQFTMKDFRKYARKQYKHVFDTINTFLSAADKELDNRGYFQKKGRFSAPLIITSVLLFIAAINVLAISSAVDYTLVYLPLGMIVAAVLVIIAACLRPRLTEKGEYAYQVWQGLKKFMLEFSRMKEYDVPQLPLWEEYLVYATMMGISSQVCRNLRLVYPQLNDDDYLYTNWNGTYMYYMFGSNSNSFMGSDFGSSLTSTIGSISRAATRLANPSSSSGGSGFGGGSFSGGGGGFGGGGGGVR